MYIFPAYLFMYMCFPMYCISVSLLTLTGEKFIFFSGHALFMELLLLRITCLSYSLFDTTWISYVQ